MGVSKSKSGVSSEFFLSEDAVFFLFERDVALLHHVRIVASRVEVGAPVFGIEVEAGLRVGAAGGDVGTQSESFALLAIQLALAACEDVLGVAAGGTILHNDTSCYLLRVDDFVLMTTCYLALRAVGNCV